MFHNLCDIYLQCSLLTRNLQNNFPLYKVDTFFISFSTLALFNPHLISVATVRSVLMSESSSVHIFISRQKQTIREGADVSIIANKVQTD